MNASQKYLGDFSWFFGQTVLSRSTLLVNTPKGYIFQLSFVFHDIYCTNAFQKVLSSDISIYSAVRYTIISIIIFFLLFQVDFFLIRSC